MDALEDAFEVVGSQRKVLELYTGDEALAAAFERQFATRNVRVERHPLPSARDRGFVVVRSVDGEFRGALGVETLEAILSPVTHPPWELSGSDHDARELFSFLDDTLFSSYDRRQMLATAREIEERAWRADAGTLYAGFQNAQAFAAQRGVYGRFASERDVDVRVFVEDEWTATDEWADTTEGSLTVVTDDADEIGAFWFVIYDGGGTELQKCGLLAREVVPGRFYGFWTYDPALVAEIVDYLAATYLPGEQ